MEVQISEENESSLAMSKLLIVVGANKQFVSSALLFNEHRKGVWHSLAGSRFRHRIVRLEKGTGFHGSRFANPHLRSSSAVVSSKVLDD